MKFLSCTDVQKKYGISRSTSYRWVDDPQVRFPAPLKIGRRILWREEDLDAFDARIANKSRD